MVYHSALMLNDHRARAKEAFLDAVALVEGAPRHGVVYVPDVLERVGE